MLKNLKKGFIAIWKDPVASKVISVGIVAAIAVGWAKVTKHSWSEIYGNILKGLNYTLPLYVFLAAIAIYFVIIKTIQLIKKRKDPFWDEQFGNYTFKELYNKLLTTKVPVQTRGMQWFGQSAPEGDYLFLFKVYSIYLNTEVNFESRLDDGNYCYGVFAPRMVQFGLVDVYDKPDENLPDKSNKAFKTSALGFRFLAYLDKLELKEIKKEIKNGKRLPNGDLKEPGA